MKRRTVVGDPINFRGMARAPVNEQGVVFLFGKIAHDLGFEVEVVRSRYPDCVAKRRLGKDRWEDVRVEFEFRSSDFKRHDHDSGECDILVCWEHDWTGCPKNLEVIELRQQIMRLRSQSDPVRVLHRGRGLEERDKLIRELVFKQRRPRGEVAKELGLSEMSVSRILRGKQRKETARRRSG
jgi:hypothetical protein